MLIQRTVTTTITESVKVLDFLWCGTAEPLFSNLPCSACGAPIGSEHWFALAQVWQSGHLTGWRLCYDCGREAEKELAARRRRSVTAQSSDCLCYVGVGGECVIPAWWDQGKSIRCRVLTISPQGVWVRPLEGVSLKRLVGFDSLQSEAKS